MTPRLASSLIALLLIASLITAPAAAFLPEKYALPYDRMGAEIVPFEDVTTLDFNPYEDDQCIVAIIFEIPAHSEVDFTLHDYQQTIPGTLSVSDESINRVFQWSLGEESIEHGRLKALNQGGGEYFLRTWTDSIYNETITGTVYAGLSEYYRGPTPIVYVPLNAAISRITLTASEPIDVKVYTVPVSTFYISASEQTGNVVGFLDTLIGMGEGTVTVISFAWGIFSQIFIENFAAVLVLYVSLTGAIAVSTKRDIFKALETWIGYQVSLIEFMLKMVDWIISIITRIINALKPL